MVSFFSRICSPADLWCVNKWKAEGRALTRADGSKMPPVVMQSSVASVLPTPTADLTSRLRPLKQLRSVYPEIQRGSFFFFFPTVQHVFPTHGPCCKSVHFSLCFRKSISEQPTANMSSGFTEELQLCDHDEAKDLTSCKPIEELTSWSDDVVVAVTVSLREERTE